MIQRTGFSSHQNFLIPVSPEKSEPFDVVGLEPEDPEAPGLGSGRGGLRPRGQRLLLYYIVQRSQSYDTLRGIFMRKKYINTIKFAFIF